MTEEIAEMLLLNGRWVARAKGCTNYSWPCDSAEQAVREAIQVRAAQSVQRSLFHDTAAWFLRSMGR